jgi:hypothetical protein
MRETRTSSYIITFISIVIADTAYYISLFSLIYFVTMVRFIGLVVVGGECRVVLDDVGLFHRPSFLFLLRYTVSTVSVSLVVYRNPILFAF